MTIMELKTTKWDVTDYLKYRLPTLLNIFFLFSLFSTKCALAQTSTSVPPPSFNNLSMINLIVGGGFTLLVAIITWLLAGFREKEKFCRDIQIEHVRRLENLYATTIETLEMSIRITLRLGSYDETNREDAKNNALLRLLSTKKINDQLEVVSDHLYQWSSNYRQGQPKPFGDSGMAIIRSGDSNFVKNAKEIYPKLNSEIMNLVEMMTDHLAQERKFVKK